MSHILFDKLAWLIDWSIESAHTGYMGKILYNLHALNRDIDIIKQSNNRQKPAKGTQCPTLTTGRGCWRGNSIMVSLPLSVCFRKVESYQHLIDFSPPVPTTGSPKAVHVLSCLFDNACKRSLAICCKSRASCPVSRFLSVPIWPECAEQGR